jgi:hypothetical protein
VQYLQQGVAGAIKQEVDKSFLYDFISTEFQEPNQLLAREGSITGALATLDLSEASDRISWSLVEELVRPYPDLYDAVAATRSTRADVPGHGIITLAKYASMGSALCFPIETMVFFIVCLEGIQDAYGIRFASWNDIKSFRGRVRVYGDDIIVPADAAIHVQNALVRYGFKVNRNKSFWTGKFRESCGKEYYDGHDVSVVKMRRLVPTSREHVSELVSLVAFRNLAYKAGLWKTVRYVDSLIEAIIPFPAVSDSSSILGRHTFLPVSGERVGGRYQRPLVRGATVRYKFRSSRIDDMPALMKTLGFKGSGEPYGPFNPVQTERDHLSMGGRPIASSITIGMGPAA